MWLSHIFYGFLPFLLDGRFIFKIDQALCLIEVLIFFCYLCRITSHQIHVNSSVGHEVTIAEKFKVLTFPVQFIETEHASRLKHHVDLVARTVAWIEKLFPILLRADVKFEIMNDLITSQIAV
jgi:hypothetical protein